MIKIIVNPTAGGGSAVDHASTLARACADAGISVHVHVAANRDDSVRTAMETAPRGLVVACGGDGTVHDCLQGVMRAESTSPRIAIWPVGTGNDIDRGLRLTKNGTPTEPTTTGGNHRPTPRPPRHPSTVSSMRSPINAFAPLMWVRFTVETLSPTTFLVFCRAASTRTSTNGPMPCRHEWGRPGTCWVSPENYRRFAPAGTPLTAMAKIAAWRAWCWPSAMVRPTDPACWCVPVPT